MQTFELFLLAIPIACASWTVTHEEIFREFHEICVEKSVACKSIVTRKFFYLFTCEYCFSHYVTLFFIVLTGYQMLYQDWRGYILAEFSLVFLANVYMGLFAFLRQNLKKEKFEIEAIQQEIQQVKTKQD
jgi:hypothetical protein